VEGGIWHAEAGPLAYAFPTYQGTGPKTDLPVAERNQIQAVNEQAAREEQPVERQSTSQSQTILLSGLSAWGAHLRAFGLDDDARPVGARVRPCAPWPRSAAGANARHLALDHLDAGRLVTPRSRYRDGARSHRPNRNPRPARDRGTRARSHYRCAERSRPASRRGTPRVGALAVRVTTAERLAAIGRVAAGVAHEIRNPIAALRLQGENALAGDDARRQGAIGDMLEQVARLDALVASFWQ